MCSKKKKIEKYYFLFTSDDFKIQVEIQKIYVYMRFKFFWELSGLGKLLPEIYEKSLR